ncbi:hypothetical protein PM082_016582 [Marasmius tenuissimus]|nr:hypothetical protein PM082_016582 [Marasmius tenuissimus]
MKIPPKPTMKSPWPVWREYLIIRIFGTRPIIGLLIGIAGCLLRIACYRSLGSSFTFERSAPKELVTTGPCAFVRHLSYLGLWLALFGLPWYHLSEGAWIIESGLFNWQVAGSMVGRALVYGWAIFLASAAALLSMRAEYEDMLLKKQFGREWEKKERVLAAYYNPQNGASDDVSFLRRSHEALRGVSGPPNFRNLGALAFKSFIAIPSALSTGVVEQGIFINVQGSAAGATQSSARMERLFWVCFTDLQDTLIFANDIHYGRILESALLVASITITTSFVLPLHPLPPSFVDHLPTVWRSWDSYVPWMSKDMEVGKLAWVSGFQDAYSDSLVSAYMLSTVDVLVRQWSGYVLCKTRITCSMVSSNIRVRFYAMIVIQNDLPLEMNRR